jgi:serine/threonine protein kinase
VLDALACAHAKGIVHRDLKPANLMLSGTGARRNALVLDFGLGGLAEGRRRKQWQTLTQSREFLGTPLYAAPEQLAGETPTPRADLYAWGLIFLECLTGRHPFEEAGAAARLLTGGGAVEIPEWLRSHRLGELLAAVTAREVEKRDVAVEALIEALDAIGRGELPVAPVESKAPPPLTEHGERRHLTVMFCDLVGSVALSRQLDAGPRRHAERRGAAPRGRRARHADRVAEPQRPPGIRSGSAILTPGSSRVAAIASAGTCARNRRPCARTSTPGAARGRDPRRAARPPRSPRKPLNGRC